VKDKWRAETTIGGKQGFLTKLYVKMDEKSAMPKVLFVDIFGEDAGTGSKLTEHITKNQPPP
jgi:hypothetical protein